MTRTFDLSSTTEGYFPLDVLRELRIIGEQTRVRWVAIGAVARDLVVHLPLNHPPQRATHDVDIAVAVEEPDGYARFTQGLARRRGGEHAFQISRIPVDVLPTAPADSDGTIEFADGNRLNIIGLAEAAARPDRVVLPHGVAVEVASIEAQCALKLLAWRDRNADDTKDAVDFISLLSAASEGLYGDEAWSDGASLEANDHDIFLAGAYRLGSRGRELFTQHRACAITSILQDPITHDRLPRHARAREAAELLDAYARGFSAPLRDF